LAAQIALETDRFKIVPTWPGAQTSTRELQNFQVKVTAAANDYVNWGRG
jgi:hypothetical protein